MLRVLTSGLHLPWRRPPPPFCARPISQPVAVEVWGRAEVQRWVANGFCRPATLAEQASAQWTSATFVADVERKPRLVVDMSSQNEYLHDRRFKYETIPAFVSMLKRGDHMASWDVSDAFHHIQLAPRERLAFRVGQTLYVPLTLPFGLKLAPWALTKLLRPVIQHLRSLGYLVLPYMDDFAISLDQPTPVSAAQATAARAFAVALFSRLGLHVHPSKGTALGTCRLAILGFLIDTERCLLVLPPGRRHKLVGAAHSLLRSAALDRRWVRSRALQRFCGMAASASLAIRFSRHRLRSLYSSLPGPRGRSRLSTLAMKDLVWWASLHTAVGIGRTLWEGPTAMDLDTDASSYAWGAVRDLVTPAQGFFALASRGSHINRKELLAIIYAIESFPTSGPGVVRVRADSTVVMVVVNSLCSRSPTLHPDVIRLRRLLRSRGLGIEATWLASVENNWADRLSRDVDSSDWRIQRSVWAQLDCAWGPLTIDRFATPLSARLVRFNARVARPGAEAVDAMAQSWVHEANYCAPPLALAATVLRQIFQERATAMVVLPKWPAQPWWRRAVTRAHALVALPPAAIQFTRSCHARQSGALSWRMVAFYFRRGGTPPTAVAGAPLLPIPSWPPLAFQAPAPPLPPAF